MEWWPHPYRVLRTGGLMLVDNAHHPAPDELVDFVKLINNEPGLDHLTLMTGSGLILARKS
jgi:predicted O-methyltransferase YrrM